MGQIMPDCFSIMRKNNEVKKIQKLYPVENSLTLVLIIRIAEGVYFRNGYFNCSVTSLGTHVLAPSLLS